MLIITYNYYDFCYRNFSYYSSTYFAQFQKIYAISYDLDYPTCYYFFVNQYMLPVTVLSHCPEKLKLYFCLLDNVDRNTQNNKNIK